MVGRKIMSPFRFDKNLHLNPVITLLSHLLESVFILASPKKLHTLLFSKPMHVLYSINIQIFKLGNSLCLQLPASVFLTQGLSAFAGSWSGSEIGGVINLHAAYKRSLKVYMCVQSSSISQALYGVQILSCIGVRGHKMAS